MSIGPFTDNTRPRPIHEIFANGRKPFPFRIAAPSFLIPGTVAENVAFLDTLVPEIAVLLFQTDACLAYDERDLPSSLARMGVAWHLHLPLDLPWAEGPRTVWERIAALLDKTAFLTPWAFVLHPPRAGAELSALAKHLRAAGYSPSDFLLENIEGNDLSALWDAVLGDNFSACLDLGHVLTYGQESVLARPDLWDRVRMLHVNAPGPKGRHLSLAALDARGRELLREMLGRLAPGATVTIEVFDAAGWFESAALLADWWNEWNA